MAGHAIALQDFICPPREDFFLCISVYLGHARAHDKPCTVLIYMMQMFCIVKLNKMACPDDINIYI